MSDDTNPAESRVVELIENAITSTAESEKVSFLNQAQELVIHNDILDNFLDELLGFQNDRFAEVRKFVASFIEVTCKKEPEYFPKVIVNLNMILSDEVPNVMKKAIQVLTQLYKVFLVWISNSNITEEIESTWEVWNQIKNHIFALVDGAENDGVRTQCVKFIEMVIMCQTKRDSFTTETDFSLDQVSLSNNSLIDMETLEDEAKQLFEQLVNFQAKIHISSVNLMATMQSLSLIARQRSKLFFNKVIKAFEALSSNLPPTLAKSQVNSVNKQLKLLFLILFKHPFVYSNKQQSKLGQILTNIGASHSEINRCLQEVKKKGFKVETSSSNEAKRIKIEVDDYEEDIDQSTNNNESSKINLDNLLYELSKKFSRQDATKAADITAKDLSHRLNNLNIVCDIILSSLHLLPDKISESSISALKDSNSTNSLSDITKNLSYQLTINGVGPGIEEIISNYVQLFESLNDIKLDADMSKRVYNLIKKCIIKELKNQYHNHKVKLTQSGKTMNSAVKIKQFRLEDITKSIDINTKIKLTEKSIIRILDDDKFGHLSSKQYDSRHKLIGQFLSEFSIFNTFRDLIKEYVFFDIRNRYDILFNTIYFEFANAKKNSLPLSNYSEYLYWVIDNIINRCDIKDRDHFIQKFYFESPYLTQNVINLLKKFVLSDALKLEDCFTSGILLIKSLIEKRTKHQMELVNILLEISIEADNSDIRILALDMIKTIYQNEKLANLKSVIESFSIKCLNMLLEENPTKNIAGTEDKLVWNEDLIKVCLSPYLMLLPLKPKLLHELPTVFTSCNSITKRSIIRFIENSVQEIGMKSPEILIFVENCPEGSEALISRVIHILTDNQLPSSELVSSVKGLYQKRVSDVRFLIPVINGFSKKEIIDILPQLIKLNPVVVKEVIKRLLCLHVDSSSGFNRPILPADLMIALHKIDSSKCDLKTTIKAINLCFEEKNIYTAEVLAVVLKMLIEQNPLPTLLMRTVIQTLTHYPRLIGFVMNLLQRLILKQVWNQKKVWEGFIKCCQRTMPESFPVLLQLPPTQLTSVFETCPEIKPSLASHLQSMTESQILPISQGLIDIILKNNDSVSISEPISSVDQIEI